MNICIAFGKNWSKYVAIQMYALFLNNPNPIKLYLLSDSLDKNDLALFDKVQKKFGKGYEYIYINALDLYNEFMPSGINVEDRFSKYTLYRLLIPHVVEEDKVLYLDADTLVNSNIEELYNMKFVRNLIIAIEDIGADPYKPSINFKKEDLYVNAGVMLMNLKEIRNKDLHHKWVKEANDNQYQLHDQDIINITCKRKVGVVDMKYNTSLSTGLDIAVNDIKIMHYAGEKPWNTKNVPFYEIWEYIELLYKQEVENGT